MLSPWTTWLLFALAAGLGAPGLAVVIRALAHDRARGRRRCRRCWYDMSLAPTGSLTCPECGRAHRSERHLRRTRVHGRAALAGVGLLTAAALVGATPFIVKAPWWEWLPTYALIQLVPGTDDPDDPRLVCLHRRLDAGGAAAWERHTLAGLCGTCIASGASPAAQRVAADLAASLGPDGKFAGGAIAQMAATAPDRPTRDAAIAALLRIGPDHPDALRVLAPIVPRLGDPDDPDARVLGVWLDTAGPEAAPFAPALADLLGADTDRALVPRLTRLLADTGPGAADALPVLTTLALDEDRSPNDRILAATARAAVCPEADADGLLAHLIREFSIDQGALVRGTMLADQSPPVMLRAFLRACEHPDFNARCAAKASLDSLLKSDPLCWNILRRIGADPTDPMAAHARGILLTTAVPDPMRPATDP